MIRKAKVADVKTIHKLINFYAGKGEMLPRSMNELYESLRDFFVFEEKDKVVACCALHVDWEDLAEIKSLAVESGYTGKGIGKKLVDECIKDANNLGIKRLFALTYKPGFFEKNGFKKVDKDELPHKICSECINCPKFPDCDEVPLVREMK